MWFTARRPTGELTSSAVVSSHGNATAALGSLRAALPQAHSAPDSMGWLVQSQTTLLRPAFLFFHYSPSHGIPRRMGNLPERVGNSNEEEMHQNYE